MLYVPFGTGRHTELVIAPSTIEAVPAGHNEQSFCEPVKKLQLNLPLAQGDGDGAPSSHTKPRGHMMHDVEPADGAYLPAGHLEQEDADAAPMAVENVPGAHGVGADAFWPLHVPGGEVRQTDELDAPIVDEYVPARHG